MPLPPVSDEVIFIALILGVAIFILIGLLAAVVLVHHFENRRTDKFTWSSLLSTIADFFPKPRPKEDSALSPPATTVSTAVAEDARKVNLESAHIAKVERSPNGLQTLNWWVCFVIATYVAWSNYGRVQFLVGNTSLNFYFILLSMVSPTCFAVAWLRLTGLEWRRALRLFIWVSVTAGGILFVLPYVGFFLKYFSGQCC